MKRFLPRLANRRRSALRAAAVLGLIAAGLVGTVGRAAPVEGEANNPYPVTAEAGPWLICAASYTGPQSGELAQELCLEIRQRYNLPAYIFNRGAEERRKQQEEIDKIRQLCATGSDPVRPRIRMVRIEDQYAVLVGGYKDMESARRALDRIKKLDPPKDRRLLTLVATFDIRPQEQQKHDRPSMPMETVLESDPSKAKDKVFLNPFAFAFVAHNPTVPIEKESDKPDPFLKKLNAGESYSLLKCPKPWTLAVKSFQGTAVIQTQSDSGSFLSKVGLGSKSADVLTASAMQAHSLAELLRDRRLNFEAYVLHTRTSSVVTVGSYDSPDDPKLLEMQRQLSSLKLQGLADPTMQLYARPVPMEVPHF
jgi:hypothetical protein